MPFWSRRRVPDDKILQQRGEALAEAIVQELTGDSAAFYKELLEKASKRVTSDLIWDLQIEEMLFLVHLFDRATFERLGGAKRTVFINALFLQIRERISRSFPLGREASEFREWWDLTYNARQTEYGNYRLSTQKSAGLKGDLFWEFSKRIVERCEITNPAYMVVVVDRFHGLAQLVTQFMEKTVLV